MRRRARVEHWMIGALVASCGALWVSSASAQGEAGRAPAVAAVCLDQDQSNASVPAELCGRLALWLDASERWALAPVDQALATGGDFDPVVAVRQAEELLEAARAEYSAGDRKKGLRLHEEAAEAFIVLDPWLADRDQLATALLDLMAAQMALLKPRDAWRADETAVRLLNFVPSIRETWREKLRPGPQVDRLEAISGRLTEQKGGLELRCATDPCEVYIDGGFAGVTPLKLGAVPAGEHLVRVRRSGYVPQSRVVAVSPEDTNTQAFTLDRAQGYTAYTQTLERLPSEIGAPRAGTALGDLRALLVVDQVVALRVLPADESGQSVLEAYLYDLRSDQLLGAVDLPVRLDTGTEYGRVVATLMEELLAAQERALVAAQGDDEDGGVASFLNTWWFWTGVGAAVLVGGTVGLVLALDDEAAPVAAGPKPDPNAGTIRLNF